MSPKAAPRALVAGAVLGLALPAGALDPTAVGRFGVRTAEYDHGDAAFQCPASAGCAVPNAELRAEVYYPSDLSAGPFPLVVFQHGRHSPCYDPATGNSSTSAWGPGCAPPFVPIPNHRGFDYIGQVLASHGYIVVSISSNGISAQEADSTQGVIERAHLIEAHLALWNQFQTAGSAVDPAPFARDFVGAVDLSRVGTLGHSRAGEAAVAHFAMFSASSPFKVRAVLPIAPTNSGSVIGGVNLGVLLPYCDGDVFTLEGSLYYDRARYLSPGDESTKHTFLSLGSNHNFFNTVWTPECWTEPGSCWQDDRGVIPTPATVDDTLFAYPQDPFCNPGSRRTGRLRADQQRRVALAYVAAFFRHHLGGESAMLPFLRGDVAPPDGLDPSDLFAGYHAPSSLRLDLNRLSEASELSQTSLIGSAGQRGAVIASGLEKYLRCGFDQANPCFPNSLREVHLINSAFSDPGLSRARLQWDAPGDRLVNLLPPGARDLRRFDVLQFRIGVDRAYPESAASAPLAFSVVLSDGAASSWVSTEAQLGANELFFPPGSSQPALVSGQATVMNTLRLPLSRFRGIRFDDLRSVAFRFDGTRRGSVLLSDIAFVDDPTLSLTPCRASQRVEAGVASASLGSLPALPAFPAEAGGRVLLTAENGARTLAPGSFRSVAVAAGGRLALLDGAYFITDLAIGAGARVEVRPDTRVFVRERLAYGAPFIGPDGAPRAIFLGFAGASELSLAAPFDGTLLAPNASVVLGSVSGATFKGSFFGRELRVAPRSSLICREALPVPRLVGGARFDQPESGISFLPNSRSD